MMDYAKQAAALHSKTCYPDVPQVPHFEGLPNIAERAELANDRIQRFLDRFNGSPSADSQGLAAIPCGHLGQLRRFANAVERLEGLCTELDAIG